MRLNTFSLIAVLMMWAPWASAQHPTPSLDIPNTEATPTPPVVDSAEERTVEVQLEGLRRAGFVQAMLGAIEETGSATPTRANLRAVFAAIDANGNSVIDPDEVQGIYDALVSQFPEPTSNISCPDKKPDCSLVGISEDPPPYCIYVCGGDDENDAQFLIVPENP